MKQRKQSATRTLNDQELHHFHVQGYVILGCVLSSEQVEIFRDLAGRMPRRPEDKGTLFFTQKRGGYPEIQRFAATGPQLAAMEQLIGPNLRCWFDQFVIKPPHENKAVFPWHQDNGYISLKPDTNVTVWIALDDVTPDNGCIWVVPGSHRQGALPHRPKDEASWHIEVDVDGDGIAVPLKAGEAVAFSGYMFHRSLGNWTDRPRRAFFLEYCHADATLSDGTPVNESAPGPGSPGGISPVVAGESKYG